MALITLIMTHNCIKETANDNKLNNYIIHKQDMKGSGVNDLFGKAYLFDAFY